MMPLRLFMGVAPVPLGLTCHGCRPPTPVALPRHVPRYTPSTCSRSPVVLSSLSIESRQHDGAASAANNPCVVSSDVAAAYYRANTCSAGCITTD
ncbi:hypothetical protein PR003_g15275 [Phytophthora rubi]|uniref:Secreted protein n=1 Tax=Phytophthora rubi TaxID=129364 RepID=A0A6A3MFD8_9STRA|nr:hypothetical protein PR002_g16216 [Phytophthora rubi]KAE9028340.1 hypothetical protein PR001_g11762 [Phytophthora rubi]KAE9330567.1 hypothetical protein PR003_g15275 [Phytophthora rubi]